MNTIFEVISPDGSIAPYPDDGAAGDFVPSLDGKSVVEAFGVVDDTSKAALYDGAQFVDCSIHFNDFGFEATFALHEELYGLKLEADAKRLVAGLAGITISLLNRLTDLGDDAGCVIDNLLEVGYPTIVARFGTPEEAAARVKAARAAKAVTV